MGNSGFTLLNPLAGLQISKSAAQRDFGLLNASAG
jgi:hypothetical protein